MPLTTSRVEASPVLRMTDGDSALAVQADDVGLRREAVADGRDVAQVSGGAAHRLDGQVIQFLDGFGIAVEFHVVLEFADLGGAARQDNVLRD